MGQLQSRLSLSVGTKILISVVTLLCLAILFVNATAIRILFEDKRTYTLQSQSTEALLAARDFANTAKRGLDSLRLALGVIDPLKPLAGQAPQVSRFDAFVENQSDMVGIQLALANPLTGAADLVHQGLRTAALKENDLTEQDLAISPETVKEIAPELLNSGYSLFSVARVGAVPLLGVAVADLAFKDNPAGVPVAVGFIPLKGFGKDIRASELTIASLSGSVLFASDPELLFSRRSVSEDPLFDASVASQLAAGTKEYESKGEKYLGSFVRPGLQFVVLTRIEWRKAMSSAYALIEQIVLLGAMAVGMAIVFAIFFAKTLTAPLNRLFLATQEVAAGNFNVDLVPGSGDEIGTLTESFVSMSRKINQLVEGELKKAHLENELAIASTVQQTLIPPPVFDTPFVQIRSLYKSATECGGDWWGFFGVGQRMCVMIADATGHGLPSALITASARSCFSVMHKLALEEPEFGFSPAAMLSYANRVVHDASQGRIMMTFFIAVLDFGTGELQYASAGHNPPWLFKKQDGGFKLQSLTCVGQRLGEAREVPPFEEKSITFSKDDILFLYTDGLTEGKNLQDEMYGKKRVRKMVESRLADGPDAVIAGLMEEFMAHNQGKSLDDDVTLAVLRILDTGQTETVQA